MTLQNSQYDMIMRRYQARQHHNRHELDEHYREAYSKIPRLREIDDEVAEQSVHAAMQRLAHTHGGSDPDLNSIIKQLSGERVRLLVEAGFPADYLEPHYDCALCRDTGYVDGHKCSCFKRACVDLLYTQSGIRDILQKENFSTFSFDWYSDKIINEATGRNALETAQEAYRISREFTENFDTRFDNLFFYGCTGVGKTFLSHCIAKELMDSAHFVMYYSSSELFDTLANGTFGRNESDREEGSFITDCDLLIIDDLGTEFINNFVASQLFACINDRILKRKSTIISTNLALDAFRDTYSERIFSRILSHYTMIKLVGDDIRLQKKLGGSHD